MNAALQNANGPDEGATSVRAGSHQLEIGNMNRTENNTAPAATLLLSQAYEIVSDMENDMVSVQDMLDILARLAETLDSQDGACVQRIAWIARDFMKSAETKRRNLFRLTHPGRDHFEAAGWPT